MGISSRSPNLGPLRKTLLNSLWISGAIALVLFVATGCATRQHPPDQSTPQAVLGGLSDALVRGDEQAYRLLIQLDPAEPSHQMFDAQVSSRFAAIRLNIVAERDLREKPSRQQPTTRN